MPNRARKKIRIGISKLMPRPRMIDRKKPVYSSMVTMGVKLWPKSTIRILQRAGQHIEVAEGRAGQKQPHRGRHEGNHKPPLFLVEPRRNEQPHLEEDEGRGQNRSADQRNLQVQVQRVHGVGEDQRLADVVERRLDEADEPVVKDPGRQRSPAPDKWPSGRCACAARPGAPSGSCRAAPRAGSPPPAPCRLRPRDQPWWATGSVAAEGCAPAPVLALLRFRWRLRDRGESAASAAAEWRIGLHLLACRGRLNARIGLLAPGLQRRQPLHLRGTQSRRDKGL